MKTVCSISLLLLLTAILAGCERAQSSTTPSPGGAPGGAQQKPPPAEVYVVKPEVKQVTDFTEYTGHLYASQNVDLHAKVTGYLEKINFTDGALVKAGTVLFEIDPSTFEDDLASKEALLNQGQRHAERLKFDLDRAESLIGSKTISQETYDQRKFDYLEALAQNKSLAANREMAAKTLSWTKVIAPIDGRMSNRKIDKGNLITANTTLLARLVLDDPIYAYFDIEEPTLLTIRRLQEAGKMPADGKLKVQLALIDEKTFSGKRFGDLNYTDTELDPQTGTLRYRAVFPNKDHLLTSQMQMKVRLPLGEPHPAVVIPERALVSDQNRKYVYVVKDNKAVYRNVTVGIPVEGGKRVIDENLAADEPVIVSGLQRVRPGSDVVPKEEGADKPAENGSPAAKPADKPPAEKPADKPLGDKPQPLKS